MAYEYLNDATDRMFEILNKSRAVDTIIEGKGIDTALVFYECVLKKGKFRSQRWHFQHKLFEFNLAFTAGYFKTRIRELSPSLQDDVKEYLNSKKNAAS